LAIVEGNFASHYLIQSKICKISCVGSFNFYNQKDDGGNAPATKNKHQQTISQAHQGEGEIKRK
jgi:hypothetical protein